MKIGCYCEVNKIERFKKDPLYPVYMTKTLRSLAVLLILVTVFSLVPYAIMSLLRSAILAQTISSLIMVPFAIVIMGSFLILTGAAILRL